MDVGKFLRLQGAIQATIEESKDKNSTQAGSAVQDAYFRLRQEARDATPEEDREEFDRLLPDTVNPGPKTATGGPASQTERYGIARTLLATLSAWLGGYVQQARMELEARAYAEERVKAERGVGFRGSQAE